MRKTLLVCILAVMVFACKSAPVEPATQTPVSNAPTSKLDRSTQVGMKGNWQITSVTFPGSEYIKVNSFNLADSKCFIGSTWNFISNNNKGTMTLNSPN